MIEFGFCMLCHKEIAPKCGECGTRKPGSQYTEVKVDWTNGSKMAVSVCVDCAVKNAHTTAHGKQLLTKAHHDHWDEKGLTHDKGIIIV